LRSDGRNRAAGTFAPTAGSWTAATDSPQQLETAAVARLVDDQNAQKAKIARNTGCEHNRDSGEGGSVTSEL
jgi:hypothetical protein